MLGRHIEIQALVGAQSNEAGIFSKLGVFRKQEELYDEISQYPESMDQKENKSLIDKWAVVTHISWDEDA